MLKSLIDFVFMSVFSSTITFVWLSIVIFCHQFSWSSTWFVILGSITMEFSLINIYIFHKTNTLYTNMTLLDLWTFTYSNFFLSVSLSPPFVSCLSDSLSELETDIKVFKDSLLKILDEDEIIEELCLTKWTDPRVLYVTHAFTYTYINHIL